MIQEKLVISDTNILLDLISVDMLEDFFSLPCDFSTTDFVISEIIQPAQIKAIEKYTKLKKLDIGLMKLYSFQMMKLLLIWTIMLIV